MRDRLTTAQNVLNQALPEVRNLLADFVSSSSFNSKINLAFGLATPQQNNDAALISQWLTGTEALPEIEIVSSNQINDAWGAYAAANNTIYLSQEFLLQNSHNSDAVENVLLEELGHAFSEQLAFQDAPGDEGAIFSLLVRENAIAPATLAQLKKEDDTVTVSLDDRELQIEQAQAGVNPAFDLIGLTELRNDPNFAGIDGTGFDVAVIDSGLDRTHSLLDNNYRDGFDYVDNDDNPNDLNAHGTHVSGIVGAEDENIGVAPDVGLIGLKAGNEEFPNQVINDALQSILDDANDPNSESNVVAVNLSLGGGFFTSPTEPDSRDQTERRRLIDELEAVGIVVVAAAGNSYIGKEDNQGNVFDIAGNLIDPNQEPNLSSPAIYSTIAVGAVWQNNLDLFGDYTGLQDPGQDRVAVFSQRLNADNFIFAPGVQVNSTNPTNFGGGTISISGTSQASPHVAGAVALLQEIAAGYSVQLSPEQVRDYLINHADLIVDGDDETDTVTNTETTYPRINIYQSAIALRNDLENNSLPDVAEDREIENIPNDLIDGAIDVTLGNDRQPLIFDATLGYDSDGAVSTADVDLYRITIPDNGSLEIDIDTPYPINFPDSYLRLFDANGEELFFDNQLVASDDNLAPGEIFSTTSTGESVVFNDADAVNAIDGVRTEAGYQPGNYGHVTDSYLSFSGSRNETYYIGVSDFSNQEYDPTSLDNRLTPLSTDGGQYELIATFINDDIDGSIAQITSNLTLPTEGLAASIGSDGTSDGTSEIGAKDVDFYRINSATEVILEIDIDSATETSIVDPVDSVVVLFDEEGNLLGSNDDTDTLDSQLRFKVEPNTDYYAAVTGFGNQDFDPFATGSGSGGDTGDYLLNSRLLPSSIEFEISDNIIDGNLVNDVVFGDSISGRIGDDGGYITGKSDVDLYRFTPESDGTVDIRVNANQEFNANTFLRFFDADGVEIAANDNENALTRGSFLEVEVEAGTTYYIGVNGSSSAADSYNPVTGEGAAPGSQGEYTLSVGDLATLSQPNSDSRLPVYRFFRPDLGVHFYTADDTEKDFISTNLPNYIFEGVSYQSVDPLSGAAEATPVYRLFNQDSGVHLYTVSETERDVVADLPNYTFEGEAFYGYEVAVNGSIPIHRFYNQTTGAHFYTPIEAEKDAVEAGLPEFAYEGIAYYALPSE